MSSTTPSAINCRANSVQSLGQTADPQIGQLTSHLDQMQSHFGREGRLSSGPELIQQPFHTLLLKAKAPFVDVPRGHTHFLRRTDATYSVSQKEDGTRPSRHPGGCRSPALLRQQHAESRRGQHNLPTASSSPPTGLASRRVHGGATVLTAAHQNILNRSCFWHGLSCRSLCVLSSPYSTLRVLKRPYIVSSTKMEFRTFSALCGT